MQKRNLHLEYIDPEQGIDLERVLSTLKTFPVPDFIFSGLDLNTFTGLTLCSRIKRESSFANTHFTLMGREADEEVFENHKKLRFHADHYIICNWEQDEVVSQLMAILPYTRETVVTHSHEHADIQHASIAANQAPPSRSSAFHYTQQEGSDLLIEVPSLPEKDLQPPPAAATRKPEIFTDEKTPIPELAPEHTEYRQHNREARDFATPATAFDEALPLEPAVVAGPEKPVEEDGGLRLSKKRNLLYAMPHTEYSSAVSEASSSEATPVGRLAPQPVSQEQPRRPMVSPKEESTVFYADSVLSLREELKKAQVACEQTELELGEQKVVCSTLSRQNVMLRQQLESLEQTCKQLTAERDNLEQENIHTREKLSELLQNEAEKSQNRFMLEQNIREHEAALVSARQQLRTLEHHYQDLEQNYHLVCKQVEEQRRHHYEAHEAVVEALSLLRDMQ
jgi:hypothetical protein